MATTTARRPGTGSAFHGGSRWPPSRWSTIVAGGAAGSPLSGPTRWLRVAPAAAAEGCQPPSGWQSTKAVAVPGVPSDFDLTSFDGTTIRIHWFPDPSADGRARPTVLMGPGWG